MHYPKSFLSGAESGFSGTIHVWSVPQRTWNRAARNRTTRHYHSEVSMKNVEFSVKGNTLTITVDLTKEFGPSSSGKTIIIASTEGSFPLPGRSEVVGLNVYRKK